MPNRFHELIIASIVSILCFLTGNGEAQDFNRHWARAQKAMTSMDLEKARKELTAALATLGSPPSDTAKAEQIHELLAGIDEGASRVAEAAAHQASRLELMEARLGKDSPELIPVLERLAQVERKLGRMSKGLDRLKRAETLARSLPPKSQDAALERIFSEQVRFRQLMGELEAALPPLQSWLRIIRTLRGKDSSDLIYPLRIKARLLRALRRHDEVIPVCREWIRLQKIVWKGEHAGLAEPLEQLSQALVETDRLEEASKVCDKWREYLERARKDHPEVPRVLMRRADIASKAGRHDEETKFLEEAALRSRGNAAWGGSRAGIIYRRLAMARRLAGHPEKAYEAAVTAVEKLEKSLGRRDPDTLLASLEKARCARACGRLPEAVGLLRRLIRRWERLVGKEHPALVKPLELLGAYLIEAGSETEGRTVLDRADGIAKKARKRHDP